MILKDYQEQVKRTLPDLGSIELNIAHMIFGMTSEYEEQYNAKDEVNFSEELADNLWYLCNYCNFKNIDLWRVFQFIDGYYEIQQKDDYLQQLQCAVSKLTDLEKKILAYKKVIQREDIIDAVVKIAQRLNDCYYYDNLSPNASMEKNIKKLQARYPDKFSEEKALNRNLKVERQILEK